MADRDDRRPPDRVRVPERDHGVGGGGAAKRWAGRRRARAIRTMTATASWRCDVRDGLEDRRVRGPVLFGPDERRRRVLAGRDDVHAAEVLPAGRVAGEAVLLDVRALRLVDRDDAVVRLVVGVEVAGPLVARRREQRVLRLLAEQRVGQLVGLPALGPAVDEPDDVAVVGDEDVAVDVQRVDLRDVAGDGQPVDRVGREARAVAGRVVDEDLLLRRVDDVEVVEAGAGVAQERPDRPDVVAPAGAVRDPDLGRRAGALVVGRAPAPQDVLLVDDRAGRGSRRGSMNFGAASMPPAAFVPARGRRRVADLVAGSIR